MHIKRFKRCDLNTLMNHFDASAFCAERSITCSHQVGFFSKSGQKTNMSSWQLQGNKTGVNVQKDRGGWRESPLFKIKKEDLKLSPPPR